MDYISSTREICRVPGDEGVAREVRRSILSGGMVLYYDAVRVEVVADSFAEANKLNTRTGGLEGNRRGKQRKEPL